MNNLQNELFRILDAVVGCCATQVGENRMSLTKEDVLGKGRGENLVMTRCILIGEIIGAGYSITTASQFLQRSVQAIRHLQEKAIEYHKISRAYRIAEAEATLMCKDINKQQIKDK